MTTKQLDNGYSLAVEQRDGMWTCEVIDPTGTIVDTLTPLDGVGMEESAIGAGMFQAERLAYQAGLPVAREEER